MRNIKKLVLAILVLVTLFNVGCSSSHDFEHQVNVAVKPYRFSIAGWEVNTFFTEIKQLFHQPVKNAQTDTEITNEYISLGHQIQDLKKQNQCCKSSRRSEPDKRPPATTKQSDTGCRENH